MRVIALRQSSGVLSNPSSRQVGRRGETESDLIRAGSGTLTVVEDKQWRKSELSDWVSASKESEPAQALLENHLRGFENSWLATTYRESTRIQERLVRNRMAERLTQYRKMLSRNSWNDPAQMLGLRAAAPASSHWFVFRFEDTAYANGVVHDEHGWAGNFVRDSLHFLARLC